jgi:Amt family ammonium transporter
LVVAAVFLLLIPFAAVGLSLINTGLGRSRSAAHTMLTSLGLMAAAAVVYFVCGFAWQGFPGRPGYEFVLAGRPWNWIAAEPWFFQGLDLADPASLGAWFGMLSVGLAALIPLGAAVERWRLSASLLSTVLLAGWTYPWFAHWVWGGGWLAELGVNYGLGHGFLDAGGSSTIQAVGGLTALALVWILGPRRGKYSLEGAPAALPGHNAVLVLSGCWLALVGWLGLNGAGSLLLYGLEPGAGTALIALNTMLAAAAGVLASAAVTGARFRKPDASLSANGFVGGLVASSAACAFMAPAVALLTGLIAGVLVTLAVPWLELRLALDDPGGAVSVHAVGGIWGVLALGFFARPGRVLGTPGADAGQWLAQLVGVATLVGFVFPLTYGLNWLLNRLYPQRVAPEAEQQGLDLYELGAGAYPEFPTHTDEFGR